MVLVLGSLFDPADEELLFVFGQWLRMVRRRHAVVVAAGDAGDDFACLGITGSDRAVAVAVRNGRIADIQPEVGFACAGIGAMTGEAAVREDRPDIAIELDGVGGTCTSHQQGEQHERESARHGGQVCMMMGREGAFRGRAL